MKTRVNVHALETTRIDCAQLGPLGMIAHPMPDAGTFVGRILSGDIEVGSFLLDVNSESEKTQVDIDLSKLVLPAGAGEQAPLRYKVRREGFVVFFVSKGPGGFRVLVETAPAEGKKKEGFADTIFDSLALRPKDIFVATLIRPGLWIARDLPSGSEAAITVAYPELGKTPYRPNRDAKVIKITDSGMDPSRADIGAGKGIVLLVEREEASIIVEFKEPDEGKDKKRGDKPAKRRVRWTNPRSVDGSA